MHGKRWVLLVEDDRATYSALRLLLAHNGWQVRVATTLAEARELLALQPQWMILDLMLPDGSGEDLLREIRGGNMPIRVAVTTAARDPAVLQAVMDLRPDALLQKPIEPDELLAHLAT